MKVKKVEHDIIYMTKLGYKRLYMFITYYLLLIATEVIWSYREDKYAHQPEFFYKHPILLGVDLVSTFIMIVLFLTIFDTKIKIKEK